MAADAAVRQRGRFKWFVTLANRTPDLYVERAAGHPGGGYLSGILRFCA